jgi:FixJ family two-component response regulator
MTSQPNGNPIVFVVDDDRPMRDSLVTLVRALGFAARGFLSAAEFQQHYRREMSGCLVLDVRMPGQSGLELYEQLISERKRLPVIFITAHADVSTAVAAMKTGAVEFLEKPFDRDTLLTLVERALELDAQWRRRELEFAEIDARIARLNDRDRDTLKLLLGGKSNKEMAARLFLSERAIEMRRAAIMRKLDVTSLAELLELAITHRVMAEIDLLRLASRLK